MMDWFWGKIGIAVATLLGIAAIDTPGNMVRIAVKDVYIAFEQALHALNIDQFLSL